MTLLPLARVRGVTVLNVILQGMAIAFQVLGLGYITKIIISLMVYKMVYSLV